MTPPAGPAGGQTGFVCEGEVPRWRFGVAYTSVWTDLAMPLERVDAVQHTASVTLLRRLRNRWAISGTVGMLVAGDLRHEGRTHIYRPGGAVAFSASREWLDDWRHHTFLTTSFSGSVLIAPTQDPAGDRGLYFASDVRAGIAFGRTFWNVVSPYVALRVFGGPIIWSRPDVFMTGHDPDHHVGALGAVFTLPRNLELSIDWGVSGARGLSGGLGVAF